MSLTCCFSGHRQIPETPEELLTLSSATLGAVSELAAQGYDLFLSGGAIGFDTLAAAAVIYLGQTVFPNIRLKLCLPFRGHCRRWDPFHQQRFSYILENASDYEYISERYFPGCYHIRNEVMVRASDTVLLYYNGGRKGRYLFVLFLRQTVRQADLPQPVSRKIKKPLLTMAEEHKEVLRKY